MSYSGAELQSNHNNFIDPNILEESSQKHYDKEYIDNQSNIIQNNNSKLPKSYKIPQSKVSITHPSVSVETRNNNSQQNYNNSQNIINNNNERYQPYADFLNKKGLSDRDNTVHFDVNYLNIDSSQRNNSAVIDLEETINLTNNPLTINKNSNLLIVNHIGHTFEINDKITLSGISNKLINIRTISTSSLAFTFIENSQYLQINLPHGIDGDLTDTFSTSELVVTISEVRGTISASYLNNIPINNINGKHTIILKNPNLHLVETNNEKEQRFFIDMKTSFTGSYTPVSYNIIITFFYISGMPTNLINAQFPINNYHLQGYHIIKDKTSNSYTFELTTLAGKQLNTFGGNNVYVSRIQNINRGYPNPNNYIFELSKIFRNVVQVKMVSSEFPKSEKVIKDEPESKKNNKIYWQNLDDGDHLYSIEVTPGNYTADVLVTELDTQFLATPRINFQRDQLSGITPPYTNKNLIKTTINTTTDVVTFTSFREAFIVKPIIEVNPAINLDPVLDPVIPALEYTLTIEHPNHGLSIGQTITFVDVISHLGIPENILNNDHVITEIVDKDRYKIIISAFNLSTVRNNTFGGVSVKVNTPNKIRLRFDFTDTIGNIIGFRSPGNSISITPYNTVIANTDFYEIQVTTDEVGIEKVIKHNSLQFNGSNYLLLTCRQFEVIQNLGIIKNAFAKINLNGSPGEYVYNSFINTPKVFYNPIPELSELEFSIYGPSGDLYDFEGLDHSFTLEITSISEIPKGTGISTLTGKIQ
jgi:hypothetical protein